MGAGTEESLRRREGSREDQSGIRKGGPHCRLGSASMGQDAAVVVQVASSPILEVVAYSVKLLAPQALLGVARVELGRGTIGAHDARLSCSCICVKLVEVLCTCLFDVVDLGDVDARQVPGSRVRPVLKQRRRGGREIP